MSVCEFYVQLYRCSRRHQIPQELELQVAASYLTWWWVLNGGPLEKQQALPIYLAPKSGFF